MSAVERVGHVDTTEVKCNEFGCSFWLNFDHKRGDEIDGALIEVHGHVAASDHTVTVDRITRITEEYRPAAVDLRDAS